MKTLASAILSLAFGLFSKADHCRAGQNCCDFLSNNFDWISYHQDYTGLHRQRGSRLVLVVCVLLELSCIILHDLCISGPEFEISVHSSRVCSYRMDFVDHTIDYISAQHRDIYLLCETLEGFDSLL